MKIKKQPMGEYQTNCYIATIDNKDFIIDPGMGATSWVIDNVNNPVAILNTHGHFDHIWSNQELKDYFKIKLYCPTDDCFMLEKDPFSHNVPESFADIKVEPDTSFNIEGVNVKFHFFPGHTPGCSAIEIQNVLFSGDFIFEGSIGRVDFPYSNPNDMKNSINKILSWQNNYIIYPGHGNSTNLNKERSSLKNWLNYI